MTGVDVEKFKQLLIEEVGGNLESLLIAGISGGPDSVCLLELLQRCGLHFIVAHYNHHLRESSDSECEFVRRLALKRGLNFVYGEGNIKQYANEKHTSVEVAARTQRYSFLFEQADKHDASAVVVAHTADDQVETILMHILRGCSLDGLQGMQFISLTTFHPSKPLIRPLLHFWRNEILKHNQENNLEYVIDESNLEIVYLRNRIRNELLPVLERYNPAIKQHIFQLGETVKSDVAFLHRKTAEELKFRINKDQHGLIELDISNFQSLPLNLQRRILFMCLQKISCGSLELDFKQVEDVRTFIGHPPRSKSNNLFKYVLIRLKNGILQFRDTRNKEKFFEYPYSKAGNIEHIHIPDSVSISDHWIIQSRFVNRADVQYSSQPDGEKSIAFLDASVIHAELLIRCATPGDRYQPLGMDVKEIKVSDFFINKKIPKGARSLWPLVFHQKDLVWIPGFSPSHLYRITEKTTKIVELKLIKKTTTNY